MHDEPVTTSLDPRLTPFRDVADPARLRDEGLFVAEGRRVVDAVIAHGGYEVTDVLVSESAHEALAGPLGTLPEEVPVVVVRGPAVLREITGYRFHQGCLALVRLPDPRDLDDLPELLDGGPRLVVGLEGVTDPDNVGTIFRSASAFGAAGVVLSPGCAHPFYRKALRTSMATVLDIPFARPPSFPDALMRLQRVGYAVLAMTPSLEAAVLDDVIGTLSEPRRVVLLLGSEEQGLDASTLACANAQVRIPLETRVDSLNVAAAAAIGLHRLHGR